MIVNVQYGFKKLCKTVLNLSLDDFFRRHHFVLILEQTGFVIFFVNSLDVFNLLNQV